MKNKLLSSYFTFILCYLLPKNGIRYKVNGIWYIAFLYFLISLCLIPYTSFAQIHSDAFFGSYYPGKTECLNDVQRAEIKKQIAENIAVLKQQGKLAAPNPSIVTLLDWPLKLRAGLVDYGYHSIAAQVDHDANYPNILLDYNCGQRTYDTQAGYNHQGTDYFLWPFSWNKMDSSDVEIIAAAPGTIVYKSDGNFDRSCSFNSNNWNAVYIQHADGSVAWYGHMKKNSLTTKPVGATVVQGEYLGTVGSSGNSSGPHLHLEIYDPGNNLNDPYQGTCNNFNSSSWWINQRPYLDAAINHIASNSHPPVWGNCPNEDTKNEWDYFSQTDTVFLMTYFRFLSLNDTADITIRRPDNSIWSNWQWINTWGDYNAAYVYWWIIAGTGEPNGTWTFQADYKNQSYSDTFILGTVGTNEISSNNMISISPNPSSGQFTVYSSQFTAGKNYKLEIYTMIGEKKYQSIINNHSSIINLDVPAGMYFYSVADENKMTVSSGKIIIK